MRLPLKLALLPILFTSIAAHAGDGVLEINQTCAVNTGCFAGDTAMTCNNSGSGRGVDASGAVAVEIHNGSIAGMSSDGVALSALGIARNLRVVDSGGHRITSGATSQVTDCSLLENLLDGIDVGQGSRVTGNTVYKSGANGIDAGSTALVSDNNVRASGSFGITTDFYATVTNNMTDVNQRGIRAAFDSVVRGNTATNNTVEGIFGDVNSLIEGNTVASQR